MKLTANDKNVQSWSQQSFRKFRNLSHCLCKTQWWITENIYGGISGLGQGRRGLYSGSARYRLWQKSARSGLRCKIFWASCWPVAPATYCSGQPLSYTSTNMKKLVNSNKGLKILILTKMLCVFLVQILLFKFQHTVFFKFNFSILLLFPVPTCRHCSSDCCRVHSWFSRPPQTRLKNFAIVPTCRHYS